MKPKVFSNNKKRLIPLILVFNALVCTVSLTMAWFVKNNIMSLNSEASINKSYFDGGDGTEAHPYEIRYPRQFYFFAWLQDMGYFNKTVTENGETHYEQCYFKLTGSIDMDDYYLPPIGTTDYPFIGNFDGGSENGYTISNLHITNDESLYTDEPLNPNEDERNYQIMGTFGVVGEYGTMAYVDSDIVSVKNLVLEDVTINSSTPKNNQTLMGIAAGYVYDDPSDAIATISNIKVSGTSTLTSAATSPISTITNHLSNYALVGYTNKSATRYVQNVDVKVPNVSDVESAGGHSGSAIVQDETVAGGDLVIAPSGLTDGNGTTLYSSFTSSVTSGELEVNGSTTIPDSDPVRKTAYYRATVNSGTFQLKNGCYKYIGSNPAFSGSRTVVSSSTGVQQTIGNTYGENDDEGYKTFVNYKSNSSYRVQSDFYSLSFSQGVGWSSTYPTNCIWFKPLNAGHCFVSFGVLTNSDNSYASIYRYKRTANGAIDSNTKQEMELEFVKQGNKKVVLFDINLTSADVDFEYCIGKSSQHENSNQAHFFFLKLAGTDAQGGTTIHEDVGNSKYAIYEQTNIQGNSMAGIDGVSFVYDTTASYQLNNTPLSSYVFTSSDHSATTYSPISSAVTTPTLTATTNLIKVQVITGYDDNSNVTLKMKKIINGTTITYYYKTSSDDDYVLSTADALARYFVPHSPFPDLDDSGILFHHEIASGTATIEPVATYGVNVTNGNITILSQTIDTTIAEGKVAIDEVNNTAYTLTLRAGNTQIYPQA